MKVSVEILTGTFLDPEVSDNATVKELKEKIAKEVKVPVKRLILVVDDEECEEERRIVMKNEDEMMLRDLGVREDSHLYLFIKDLDLVSSEERSQGEGDDDEVSSEIKSRRGNEEEGKAKIDGENEDDKSMKNEVEDRDEKVEEKEKNGEEEQEKNNDVKDGAMEGEEGDKKEET